MAQRCLTAHSVVTFLRFGKTLVEALTLAAEDLRDLDDPFASEMNIVAIDAQGNHGAVSTAAQKTYVYQTDTMPTFEVDIRLHVPLS
jgi:hypothetical protein